MVVEEDEKRRSKGSGSGGKGKMGSERWSRKEEE